MALNGLIYYVSWMPRWPRELWVYMQSVFLQVISWWSLFDWYWEKSSAGRNHLTKQGRSSPWTGRENVTTSVSVFTYSSSTSVVADLSAFLPGPGLQCHTGLTLTKVDLFWPYRRMLFRYRAQKKKKYILHDPDMYENITYKTDVVSHTSIWSVFIIISLFLTLQSFVRLSHI